FDGNRPRRGLQRPRNFWRRTGQQQDERRPEPLLKSTPIGQPRVGRYGTMARKRGVIRSWLDKQRRRVGEGLGQAPGVHTLSEPAGSRAAPEHQVAPETLRRPLRRHETHGGVRDGQVLLGGGPALCLVRVEQRVGRLAAQYESELPGKILGVCGAGVQATCAEGRVQVRRIPREKDASPPEGWCEALVE